MRRYSCKDKSAPVSYAKWLAWCEDDRTTGAMLSTHVPCTLHFLVDSEDEIYGSIVINHAHTHRGHLHAGIVPWHRGKGYGAMAGFGWRIFVKTVFAPHGSRLTFVPYRNL